MDDLIIERLAPSRAADVVPLLSVQLDEHGVGMPDAALLASVLGLFEADRGEVLVARRADGEAVGVAVLSYQWTVEHGGLSAWLEELYVVPELREHGLGARLLTRALEVATAHGCRAMDLEVDAGHARVESLYVRAGFASLPRRHFTRRLVSAEE